MFYTYTDQDHYLPKSALYHRTTSERADFTTLESILDIKTVEKEVPNFPIDNKSQNFINHITEDAPYKLYYIMVYLAIKKGCYRTK